MVDIGTLRRVEDLALLVTTTASLLEEPLSDTLVHDDQSHVGKGVALVLRVVLVSKDLLKLVQLELDDLLSHGIADTITIDEDVVRQCAAVVVLVGCESAAEVLLQDVRRDDLLALLTLRAGLSVVLAQERIVGGHETNDTLLALVANIDTNEHCLG